MEIKKAIIHQVDKERHADPVVQKRGSVLTVTGPVERLLDAILTVYNKKTGKSYGRFKDDHVAYPFGPSVEKYLAEMAEFVQFSRDAMDILEQRIKGESLATGGFVLFIHYLHNGTDYLMVVLLKDRKGTAIDRETLDVLDNIHLDVSQLHFAARLNINNWLEPDADRYLSFVKGKRNEAGVSAYFREFIGCDDYADSKKETINLVKVVEEFCRSKQYDQEKVLAVRKSVHDFCQDQAASGGLVYLCGLSNYLDAENPEEFLEFANEFANEDGVGISDGFEPHKDTLKRLKRFQGGDDKLQISFDSSLYNNRVKYLKDEGKLIITNLPEKLKAQLDEMEE